MSRQSSKGPKKDKNKSAAEAADSGSFVFPDGSSYNGEFKEVNGTKVRHGKGTYTSAQESFVGLWENDKQEGEGVYRFNSGAVYKGGFSQGEFNGKGKYTFADGASYDGEWSHSKMHGKGVYVDAQKVEWAGQFFNGMFDSGKSFVSVRGGASGSGI
jgi:hypothetical protein